MDQLSDLRQIIKDKVACFRETANLTFDPATRPAEFAAEFDPAPPEVQTAVFSQVRSALAILEGLASIVDKIESGDYLRFIGYLVADLCKGPARVFQDLKRRDIEIFLHKEGVDMPEKAINAIAALAGKATIVEVRTTTKPVDDCQCPKCVARRAAEAEKNKTTLQ